MTPSPAKTVEVPVRWLKGLFELAKETNKTVRAGDTDEALQLIGYIESAEILLTEEDEK